VVATILGQAAGNGADVDQGSASLGHPLEPLDQPPPGGHEVEAVLGLRVNCEEVGRRASRDRNGEPLGLG
jgi:hypothetical protein